MKRNKILIITSSIDCTADYIIRKYSMKADFYRFDVDKFYNYEINIGFSGYWIINNKLNKESICKEEVKSIYYRKPMFPSLEEFEIAYWAMIQKDIIAVITGIADSFEGKVLSRPYILRKTENKVFQMLYAKEQSWKVPKSFIGNINNIAKSFADEKSIIKPLTTGKVYHNNHCEIYQTSFFNKFEEDISLTPIYLQEYQEKKYEVRLTIIEDSIFTIRIDSQDKLDWRRDYEGHNYSVIECPKDIQYKCMKLLEDFELKFGAFDFIVDEEENWIFLEVNPNGQWQWLEEALELDISRKIVEYLLK